MLSSVLTAAPASQQGFNWVNLIILVLIIAVAYPLLKKIRTKASESRRERWAREDAERDARIREHPEPSDPRKLPGDPE